MQKAPGFTLIEVVLVVGLLTVIFFIGFSTVTSVQKTLTRQSAKTFELILRAAAERARNGEAESSWGVYVPYDETTRHASQAVVFSGSSYTARDSSKDVVYPVSSYLIFESFKDDPASTGNDHELVFDYLTGKMAAAGSITLTFFEESLIITFSATGLPVLDPL